MQITQKLSNFVNSGRYSKNVAHSVGTALRVVGAGLTHKEQDSLQNFEDNLDQIAQRVFDKSRGKMSAVSLNTYKIRIRRLFRDYKFDSNSKGKIKKTPKLSSRNTITHRNVKGITQRIELSLRPDSKFILILPEKITRQECEIVKSVIDSLRIK